MMKNQIFSLAVLCTLMYSATACVCKDRSLCKPLSIENKKEVYAFVLDLPESQWKLFDWNKLTTIAIRGEYDPKIVCHAHENGVKVVRLAGYDKKELGSKQSRTEWIQQHLEEAVKSGFDGINIDVEFEVASGSADVNNLNLLVQETTDMYHANIPGSQVTFDVAWSPDGIDGRFYDVVTLSKSCDFLFVMSYDEQSQIFDEVCTGLPNSGLKQTAQGVRKYLRAGIPAEKLVLGVPWYGYNYTCIDVQDGECVIERVPFRGAPCSDAAGSQLPYTNMMSVLENNPSAKRMWDKDSRTPYYFYEHDDQLGQMRYDDPESLSYKYRLADLLKLRGVGMWTANFVDYSDTPRGEKERKEMWGALPQYKKLTTQK